MRDLSCMVVGEKLYGLWQKPVCFHWRKCVWFSLPFTFALAQVRVKRFRQRSLELEEVFMDFYR